MVRPNTGGISKPLEGRVWLQFSYTLHCHRIHSPRPGVPSSPDFSLPRTQKTETPQELVTDSQLGESLSKGMPGRIWKTGESRAM